MKEHSQPTTVDIIAQYQNDAIRTCNVMESNIYNSIHMILGITSEYYELKEAADIANKFTGLIDEHIALTEKVLDEAGDVFWYLFLLAKFNNLEVLPGLYINSPYSSDKAIERLNSIMKSNWIYDRAMMAPDKTGIPPINQLHDAIVSLIDWILTTYPFTMTNIMEYNINKLRNRYPEKFEKDLANNRKEDLQ